MKNKILSLLLIVITSAGSAFADFDYVTVDKKHYYLDTENHTAELSDSGNRNAESLTIPSTISYNGITYTVTSIGRQAIVNHKNLVSVSIPNTITNIGDAAFHGCSKLESIVIPNNVENIGGSAFANCSALNNVTIGEHVKRIGEQAFIECSNLTTIVIPDSVSHIGFQVFFNCTNLTSVVIGDGLTDLSYGTFTHCANLQTVIIGNNVLEIGSAVFANCSSLSSITIPSSVRNINFSFMNCIGLTSVTCMASEPPTIYNGFYGVDCSNIPLYVPQGSVDDYQSANEWKDFQPIRGINEEGIINVNTQQQTKKYIDKGKVFIAADNKIYTISGQEVE